MLPKRLTTENTLRLGYIALIAALLSRWYLHAGPHFLEDLVDATKGLLFGIAIGALLLGAWRVGHRTRN